MRTGALPAVDPSDGIEDAFVAQTPRLESAEPADELEDAGLQGHDEHGADPERCAQQDADHQYKRFDPKLHSPNGELWELFPQDDHEGIARSATERGRHVENRREREHELTEQGAEDADRHAERRGEKTKDLDPKVREDRDEEYVQDGAQADLAFSDQIDCDDDHTDDEVGGAEADTEDIAEPDVERVPGVGAGGPGQNAERISKPVKRKPADAYGETFGIFLCHFRNLFRFLAIIDIGAAVSRKRISQISAVNNGPYRYFASRPPHDYSSLVSSAGEIRTNSSGFFLFLDEIRRFSAGKVWAFPKTVFCLFSAFGERKNPVNIRTKRY